MFRNFLALSVLTLTSSAFAQDAMTPSTFKILDVRYSGNACPAGSAAVNTSEDSQAFTVTFSNFIAEIGPGIAPEQNRRSCRLLFDTEQDANWEYAVIGLNVRGFAQLDEGVTGRQAIKYGFQNKDADGAFIVKGPFDDVYQDSSRIALGQVKWSGCRPNKKDRAKDYTIVTNAQLTATNPEARGLWAVDSVDGEIEKTTVQQSFELIWRQCGNNRPKFVSSCSVTANNGSGKSLVGTGTGRNENISLRRAQDRLKRACENANRPRGLGHGRGGRGPGRPGGWRSGPATGAGPSFSCDVAAFQCSTTAY